jgi:hypothetical protein
MTWLAYSARFTPKRLSITQQPSGAAAGVALTTQPVVQILDGGGELCQAATNSVTATKHSGVTGTLSGTTSKAAVAGVATFTDLAMSVGETGVSLDFAASGLTGATSSTFTVTGSGGAVGWLANKPTNHNTVIQGLNFSDNIPNPGGTAEYVIGSTEWTTIGFGDSWVKQSDAGSGQSPPDIWRGVYPEAGTYTDGQNRGSIGRPLNNLSEFYFCLRMKLSSNFVKHPISTKLIRSQINGGTFLFQLSHDNNWFRVSTEEGPGYDYDGFILDGSAPPLGSWFTLEGYAKRGSGTGVVKVWVDGTARTNATGVTVSPSGQFTTFSIDANYGGGGSTVSADQYIYVDDVYVSTL